MEDKRIVSILAEQNGIILCDECKVQLKEEEIEVTGIGDHAVIPMHFCPQCQARYILWKN